MHGGHALALLRGRPAYHPRPHAADHRGGAKLEVEVGKLVQVVDGGGHRALHELRHTQAIQLLANGVDVKTVRTRLGHASASITLGWYAHAIPEKDHEAADLLGAILSGAKPQDSAAEEEEKSPRNVP